MTTDQPATAAKVHACQDSRGEQRPPGFCAACGDEPTAAGRAFIRHAMLGFARGSVMGGAIYTWVVAQHNPTLALIGVAGTILGAFCQEVLS